MITLEEMADEVRQEIKMRERVYPKLVASRKMRKETADKKIARMRAVHELLSERSLYLGDAEEPAAFNLADATLSKGDYLILRETKVD